MLFMYLLIFYSTLDTFAKSILIYVNSAGAAFMQQ